MTSRQNPPRHESETSCSHRRTSESASSVIQSDMFSPDKYMPQLLHRSRHRLGFVSTGEGPDCQITLTGRYSHLLVSAQIDIFLQNTLWQNAWRFAFSRPIRALMPPPAPHKSPSNFHEWGTWDTLRPSRLSNFAKLREFLMSENGQKSSWQRATGPSQGCNGVPVVLQRQPRRNSISAPP